MVRTFKNEEFGFEVEIGKVARQADGAVMLKTRWNCYFSNSNIGTI